jgi:hypothetical protein
LGELSFDFEYCPWFYWLITWIATHKSESVWKVKN